ncbi:MAG: sigma-54-dependent Fis family transcriptional regulator [Desulfobacteraceae bacterium]|jgi:DNA-binding NtrC family response regulator|nr:MAG: sigma-54-dependent Fis family transcriptional regulator [Desulfobacteraceae bacterium]
MAERLLIVEDEAALRDSLKRVFERDGYEVSSSDNAETALQLFDVAVPDLILCDIILPGMDGIEFLKTVRARSKDQMVIMMTAYASIETAVAALRAGARDYILKPVIHEELKRIVRIALNERALKAENEILKRQIAAQFDFLTIIGESKIIKALIEQVKLIADSRSNVLILGETGTGKELFTRAIHHNSSRRDKPFVPINCSAIPDHLLESELFGYVKGAFTGANQNKRGLFEEADQGTVFLDEIGDLSPHLQSKLLRVIDDHEIRPIGSTRSRKVDIRFIAATNRDIVHAVKEGRLREDLFYRINVVTLYLPPLRERKEDIPILAERFLNRYANELGKGNLKLDPSVEMILLEYAWPGNIRELRNIMERAALISRGQTIRKEDIPEELTGQRSFTAEGVDRRLSIKEYTKEFIRKHQADMNEQQLADCLGITRKALWEKRKRWDLLRQ